MLMLLHNSRKLKCLQVLAEYTNTKDADVWKSNNSLAMELVGKLEKEIKETILPCRRVEQGRKVDLKGLVKESMMLVDGRKETESAEEGRYECWCELQYELVLLWGRSEKIN